MSAQGPIEPPKMKTFRPKLALPTLKDYSVPAPSWFWNIFPSNYVTPARPKINGELLVDLAVSNGYMDKRNLDRVLTWVTTGADIGCRGKYRRPSKAFNSKSAYKEGLKVTDAIGNISFLFNYYEIIYLKKSFSLFLFLLLFPSLNWFINV